MNNHTITIPALPCESMDDMLLFWQALGFEVTYKQKAPNPYAVIHYEDYDLHLFGLKKLAPQDNFSTCLILVSEVEELHATFVERLKKHLGKIPAKGFPRISRMKPKQTRFTLTDIAGNSIIYIKHGKADETAADEYKKAGQSSFQKALSTATRLRDFKNDDAAAAKVLDNVLVRGSSESVVEYAKVLVARIELAVALNETGKIHALHTQFKGLKLSEADIEMLSDEISLLKTLEI